MVSGPPKCSVILRPAYPGASFYAILSPSDHKNWMRAAASILAISRQSWQEDDGKWCGLVVAGCDMRYRTKPPSDEKLWCFYDGHQFLDSINPHEEERPLVFDSVQKACKLAIACTNLPHVLRYNVYLWIKPGTYSDLVQTFAAELQKNNMEIVQSL